MAGLGTEAHLGLGHRASDWHFRLKGGGVVLGAVPGLACHQLVTCVGNLGKACFLTMIYAVPDMQALPWALWETLVNKINSLLCCWR